MTSAQARCDLVLDPDDILVAVDEGIDGLDRAAAAEHLERCPPCREVVRLRSVARRAWRVDREVVAPASSARAKHGTTIAGRGRRATRYRRLLAFGGTFALLACVVVVLTRATRPVAAPGPGGAGSPDQTPTPAEAPHSAKVAGATSGAAPGAAVPLAGTSSTGRSSIARMENILVPEGSRVSLGFAIGVDAIGDEGDARAEIVGPATARAPTTDSLTLERGTVKLQGVRAFAILVPGAKVEPNGAVCTVTVDERRVARVVVEGGRAVVTPGDPATVMSARSVTIDAGGSLQLDPDGSVHVRGPEPRARPSAESAPPPPPTVAPTPLVPARNSRLAAPTTAKKPSDLAVADSSASSRGSARADLERLAAASDPAVARRATFTLAEMDLASGARDQGRARLETLVTCPDAALGADATTLLARALATPADRERVWARYLGTNPPSPYRERALLDRAEALLDAGHTSAALDLCAEVRRAPHLTEPQKRQLDRLTARAR